MSRDGFLERWLSRKRAALREGKARADEAREENAPVPEGGDMAAPQPAAIPEETAPEAETAGEDGSRQDAPITEEELARLPPVETATREELRAFLRRGVPGTLRQAALRRIWVLNPRIRDHVDPALDYAWDFNEAAARAGPLASADATRLLEGMLLGRKASSAAPAPAAETDGTPAAGQAAGAADPAPEAPAPPTGAGDGQQGTAEEKLPPGSSQEDEVASARPRRHGSATPRVP